MQQKYWHKGAFFQGDGEEGVLGDVLQRDYDGPTGEDKVDKQMLPKIMQARLARPLLPPTPPCAVVVSLAHSVVAFSWFTLLPPSIGGHCCAEAEWVARRSRKWRRAGEGESHVCKQVPSRLRWWSMLPLRHLCCPAPPFVPHIRDLRST